MVVFANRFSFISVLRVASGPRVKLASCKSALNTPVVYSTDRSKAVVPVLVLLFVALWFILRGDMFYVWPCFFFLVFFSPFSIVITSLGEEGELILVHSYVCYICVCLGLSVSSCAWCLGRVAVCNCGIPWTFLLPCFEQLFLQETNFVSHHANTPI